MIRRHAAVLVAPFLALGLVPAASAAAVPVATSVAAHSEDETGHGQDHGQEHEGHSVPEFPDLESGEGHDQHGTDGSHGDERTTTERPRAQVLGSFAAVNGGVLVAAAFWRRRTKDERSRRRSARAGAGPTDK